MYSALKLGSSKHGNACRANVGSNLDVTMDLHKNAKKMNNQLLISYNAFN